MRKLTLQALRKLLSEELKLKSPEFFLSVGPAGFLNGHIVSPSFKGMGDRQRQGMIWDALADRIGPDASKVVGMLIAYAPEEWYADENAVSAAEKPKRKKAG